MRHAGTALLLMLTTVATMRAQNVEGCGVTVLDNVCQSETVATLTANDCVDSATGSRFDIYDFTAAQGQFLNFTLRPISATLRNPLLTLAAPSNDPRPPSISHGEGQSIWYRLTSTGKWRIAVASEDSSSLGQYVLHTQCFPDDDPGAPAACTYQDLLCNQVGVWNLSDASCRFSNSQQRYNSWLIWGVENDLLRLDAASSSFTPEMELTDLDGDVVADSTRVGSGARLVHRFMTTGWYFIDVFGTTTSARGIYSITSECASSGCLFPYLLSPIGNVRVDRGESATITFDADVVGAYTASLIDAGTGAVVATSTTNTIQVPAVNAASTYRVKIENECGDDESNVFTIAPGAAKKRVVRH
jgi:hypothetical protein